MLVASISRVKMSPLASQMLVQIPLAASGPWKEVTCWEFKGTAYDQGDEAAEYLTKYLEQSTRLVRYAGADKMHVILACYTYTDIS